MKTKKQNKIDEKIHEHFSNLGKKSWDSRKAKLLAKLDKDSKVVSE
jgi:hypothetical protein